MADFASFSKDMYSLVEEKVPLGRFVAPVTLSVVVLAIATTAARYVFENLLRPVASRVSLSQGGAVSWLAFFALTACVAVALVTVWIVLARRASTIEGRLRWTNAHTKLMEAKKVNEDVFEKLKERVASLEVHTDIAGLGKELLERELARQATLDKNPPRGGY